MKKVLIVTRSLYKKGGVETALLSMIDEIHTQYDIDLFAFMISKDYINKLSDKANVIRGNIWIEMLGREQGFYRKSELLYYLRAFLVVFCRLFSNKYLLKLILRTKKVKKSYDIAISYMQAASDKVLSDGNNQFVLDYISANKKIVFIHSDYQKEGFNNRYHNDLYKKFDNIVTVSNSCRKKIIECVPEFSEKVKVLHNFNQITEIKNLAVECSAKYPSDKVNFITVARLTEEKGILRMIEVIKKIENENFIWHLVGDGILLEQINKKISDYRLNDKIILYGEQDNPYPYILNASMLIVCSKYEAAPMVINESFILGVPVLTTETLSSKDQIIDGFNGIICENSIEGLYSALKDLLNNTQKIDILKKNLENLEFDNSNQKFELNNIMSNS